MILRTALATLAFATVGAHAQVDYNIYNGTSIEALGIDLIAWGGGRVEESKDVSSAGQNSILVGTSSYFQGGILQFGSPHNLAPYVGGRENLLQISVYALEAKSGGSSGGGGGGGGGGAGIDSGGGGALGGGMTAGGGGGAAAATRSAKQLDNLRLLITTTDGKTTEVLLPLNTSGSPVGRWKKVGVPLMAIPGFDATNKTIKNIAISGDAVTNFYIGEIRVVNDQTPVQGFLDVVEMNLASGDEVLLSAGGEGGFSVLEYVWDFDAKNGLQEEALGQAIYHRFRIPGEYVVTLTVRDKFGLKKPWQGTIKVTVN